MSRSQKVYGKHVLPVEEIFSPHHCGYGVVYIVSPKIGLGIGVATSEAIAGIVIVIVGWPVAPLKDAPDMAVLVTGGYLFV